MAREKLSDDAIAEALKTLSGWSLEQSKLHRKFEFTDFVQAISFMTTAAFSIEKLNHHPEWSNVYNRVVVDLTTHDSGGITKNDVELAQVLNRTAGQFAQK